MSPVLSVRTEHWPLARTFAISRGAKTEAVTVVAELAEDDHRGRGECVPYARYGESVEAVVTSLEGMRDAVRHGLDRTGLQHEMPPGAARNALDCAFWDYEAKRTGTSVHRLAGLPAPRPLVTAYTISLDAPDAMAEAAAKAGMRRLLKVKLGGPEDCERIRAVRHAAPNAELIVDANEGWDAADLAANLAACAAAGVTLVEQPLPAAADAALAEIAHPIAICADESVHDTASLAHLIGKYDAVNIKLDKAGGLTEALRLAEAAEHAGLDLMVGCMVATSLSMAPAVLLAQCARVVDLDGPLLLARDRPDGLTYEQSLVHPPHPTLWG
jgi:L-alanine-DL-glutamate epimerase-like enolase superfamily enzyme